MVSGGGAIVGVRGNFGPVTVVSCHFSLDKNDTNFSERYYNDKALTTLGLYVSFRFNTEDIYKALE